MTSDSSLTDLKSVGEALSKKLALLGLFKISDLIDFYPRRYEDYSNISAVAKIRPGTVTIKAKIKQANGRYVRRGLHITEAVASDDSSSVRLIWFNQPYRAQALKSGVDYYISGQFELSRQRYAIMNPSVELASDFPINTARIVPVYRQTKGLTSQQIRRLIRQCLPLIRSTQETLPSWLIKDQKLIARADAIANMHFPASSAKLAEAQKRLGFEEVFELSLASLLNKQELKTEKSPAVPFIEKVAKDFVKNLPFQLTDAQRKSAWQIYQDMQKTQPMNRLIEGDVGSGKTAVAAMAALMVINNGHQVALMAPTEILARQHAETLYELLKPLGLADKVGLLVGGLKPQQKTAAHKNINSGQIQFIVGTHALIQEKVDVHNLELIIIDEQHRFGVEQRKALMAKAGHMPHVLSLTATPIPRSLALTLFGELDISILDSKPPGRQAITTKICSPNSRAQLNAAIKQELSAGRQMFVVCPLISDSSILDANSAEKIYEQFTKKDFKQFKIGLLHGKLKPADKNQVMQKFVNHEFDILVTTTVIEVGVDVPNASIMLVEAAERFGLAQIHQLRGRVGRGQHKSFCYLMTSDSSAPSRRLRALETSDDGFKLAEYDLELRGPGAIYGALQHGQLDLSVAKLSDAKLIAAARNSAIKFVAGHENLLKYNQLAQNINRLRSVTNLN
ncbi:MAG: ATP-dependent DNA helicase RecG [Candidatus Saccharimonadales bacterium]